MLCRISQWLPKILSRQYDPRDVPISQKAGVTVGDRMLYHASHMDG